MSSYTQCLYHFVFSTKDRAPTIDRQNEKQLYMCIWEILEMHNCHAYRIGGIEDHIHIIAGVDQSIAVADLMSYIKAGSAKYIRDHSLFPNFDGWEPGYGGFTCHIEAKDTLVRFVKNQRIHHRSVSALDEYKALLKKHRMEWREDSLV